MSLIIIFAFLLFIGRIFIKPRLTNIPTSTGSYEAFAHLFVGFLILVPLYDKNQVLGPSHLYAWIGWGLTAWEGLWFYFQKKSFKG